MMKQKQVFLKYLTYIASMITLLIPTANLLHLNKIFTNIEKSHPKILNLSSPDAITCLGPFDFVVGANCLVHVWDTVPKSNGIILKLSYSVDGGPTVVLSSPFKDTLDLGMRSVDTFEVVWDVEDDQGAKARCFHKINIRDTLSPILTCQDITVGNDQNGRLISPRMPLFQVDFGPPAVSDNCTPQDSLILTNDYTGNKDTIGNFPIGTTRVCWTAVDKYGNNTTCCYNVTVIDNTPPVLTCPDTIKTSCLAPAPYADFNAYYTAGGDATDDVKLDTLSFSWVNDLTTDSTCFNRKTIKRFYAIQDTSGNADTCFQMIIVMDTVPPSIICKDTTLYLNSIGTASLTVANLVTMVSDNCSGVSLTTVPGLNFNCNHLATNNGQISITITAKDTCGNTSICTSVVTVKDTIKPTIICPADITISTATGRCDTLINYNLPTVNDNCSAVTPVLISGLPSGSSFSAGVHTITYTVTDAQGNSSSCSFSITVRDMIPPKITCPPIDSVGLNDSCYLTVPDLIHKIVASDNCGFISITQSPKPDSVLVSSHNTTHIITFIVTDAGGNTATCQTTVTAKDKLGPDIVCTPKRFISISGQPKVSAESFVISAYDNCGGPLLYQVRRMTSNTLQDSIMFTCDDVSDTTIVVIRVSDQHGNFTECMDTVVVEDKIIPNITQFLTDVTVSCAFPLDFNQLGIFGTYVHQDSIRQTHIINDPDNISNPTTSIQDGVYAENCPGTTVNSTFINLLTMCQTGEIKRVFAIRDAAGNILRDTQSIFVVDFDKFSVDDITWPPLQVDYYDCQRAVPDTAITKSPILNHHKCSMVAATFEDQITTHPSYCKVINRKWTVIDWCQYQKNTPGSPGKYTFEQFITVHDTIAPIFTSSCRDTVICSLADCSASVTLSASAVDSCSLVSNNITWNYKIDIGNNGGIPEITGTGSTLTGNLPLGTHLLNWEAKDPCGNIRNCPILITIRDCKAPSLVVMKGLATSLMPVMNMIQVAASTFDNLSSDNCTSTSQLKFSYSSDTNDTIRTFTCDSLGLRYVEIWLTDKAGNQTKAITTIDIQDTHGTCTNNGLLNINGSVYTENHILISDTKVKIDGGETEREVMTDKKGRFSFSNLARFNDYEISPEKNTNHLEGISTLDLVMIQRHILGLKKIESPYKLIAADINNSKSITTSDLTELRKMVLGLENRFKNNTSWRFIGASFRFNDESQPWTFTSKLNYNNLDQNLEYSDFIAIKTGDVNGSVSDNLQQTQNRTSEKLLIRVVEQYMHTGEVLTVPVYAEAAHELEALQWTMEIKPGLSLKGVASATFDIGEENIGIFEKNGKQYVTICTHKVNDLPDNNTGDELFYLIFEAKKNGSLSHMLTFSGDITAAVAVTKDLEEKALSFTYQTKLPQEVYITQNHPNPFKGETLVQLSLQQPSKVEVTIYDAKGSAIYNGYENMGSGVHTIAINEKHIGNQTGIFYCKIKTNAINKVIKMLRLK